MAISLSFSLPNNADENLKKLFNLIENYNNKPSLVRLQLIEALAIQLHKEYIQNPPPYKDQFLRWFGRDPIASELFALSPENVKFTNNRIFEMSAVPGVAIDFEELKEDLKRFNYKTKDNNFPYKIQHAIQTIIVAKEATETKIIDANLSHQRYLASLRELRTLALSVLNSFPESKSTFKKFSKLVDRLNSEINQEIIKLNTQENAENLRLTLPIPFLQEKLRSADLSEFIKQLDKDQDFVLDNFALKALGGKNNKNWIAQNMESGERFIIRLEKENNRPSEYMVEKLRQNQIISQFLAQDYFNYPAQIMDGFFPKEYNIALSEYCPKKDLLSFRYDLKDESDDVIIDKVLSATEQVAIFSKVLNENNLAYTDIKAENFLLRDNEEVVTADKKSIVMQDSNNNIKLIGQGSVPVSFKMPEYTQYASDNGTAQGEAFMAYEIGVMLHVLMLGDKENKPQGTASYVNANEQIEFNFDHPIYNTIVGEQVKDLVKALTNPDPARRISLSEAIEACEKLKIINQFEQSAPSMDRYITTLRPLIETDNISNNEPQNLKDSLNAMRNQEEPALSDEDDEQNKENQAPL